MVLLSHLPEFCEVNQKFRILQKYIVRVYTISGLGKYSYKMYFRIIHGVQGFPRRGFPRVDGSDYF